MKNLIIISILLSFNMSYANSEITLFHYNIKELDTVKINSLIKSKQLDLVKRILAQYKFDILSLNEIQYDLVHVPTIKYKTTGKNIEKIKNFLGLSQLLSSSFNMANTGVNAKTKPDGSYYADPSEPGARAHADQVNFGTMPGQYSTGALFKFKKIKEVIITDLLWKDFNPKLDLSNYTNAQGLPMPSDMQLFDKNFTDVTMDVDGKELHLILLHAVPSYGFGNPKTVNYIRNGDQLKFLEWYLTGSTDFEVKLKNIKPLKPKDYYIAVGDWNTEYSNTTNPGSLVLRRMFTKIQLWLGNPKALSFTNEGHGFGPKPFRLMLDYIAYSNNIEMLEGKIIHPDFTRVEQGCEETSINSDNTPKNMVLKTYQNDANKLCRVYVTQEYIDFKQASDHYPIMGRFKLKEQ